LVAVGQAAQVTATKTLEKAAVVLAEHCGVKGTQLQVVHMIFTLVKVDPEAVWEIKAEVPLAFKSQSVKTVQIPGHLVLLHVVAAQVAEVITCVEHKKAAVVAVVVLEMVTVVGMTEDLALKIPGAVGLHMVTPEETQIKVETLMVAVVAAELADRVVTIMVVIPALLKLAVAGVGCVFVGIFGKKGGAVGGVGGGGGGGAIRAF